jgi:hypothetical protein
LTPWGFIYYESQNALQTQISYSVMSQQSWELGRAKIITPMSKRIKLSVADRFLPGNTWHILFE